MLSQVVSPNREKMAAQESLMASHDAVQVHGGTSCVRRSCHERQIELPRLMSKLVDAVYEIKKHPDPEQEAAVLRRVWEELGYERIWERIAAPTKWYEVFVKDEDKCKYSSAPDIVIAVRGTRIRSLTDLKSDWRVLIQRLHKDGRFEHLRDLATYLVGRYSHTTIAMAGHSLGAGLALLVGKVLAKAGKPVETYLFNPPFPSADVIPSPFLRKLVRGCQAMLLGTYAILAKFGETYFYDKRVFTRSSEYHDLKIAKWTPHLFLNKGDLINLGYVHQITDRLKHSDAAFQKRLRRWVEPHTVLSLLTSAASPKHLLPNLQANSTIADSLPGYLWTSHSLEQWHEGPEWKSGMEVGGLDFGRQLAQRAYYVQKVSITLQMNKTSDCHSDVTLMGYAQTTGSTVVQFAWSTLTRGLATSKQKEVMFMFNTEQDARYVHRLWPSELMCYEIGEYIRSPAMSDFEFLLQKFDKGATTFFIYAVKRKQDPFERELDWKNVRDYFTTEVGDVTNWMKIARTVVLAGGVIF